MENLDDNVSSTGLEPLFIKEEDAELDRTLMDQGECITAQSGLAFNPSVLMKPYLQEMDDLLKSCEELTGIPLGSHVSNETSLVQSKEEQTMDSYEETSSSQAYLSTNYMDTHMDLAATEDKSTPAPSQASGSVVNRCRVTTDASRQREMPLTSAGNRLSETMVQYEGQLLGMLAMLESCMEEAGMDFEPQDWTPEASQEYVHISKNPPSLCRGTTLVPIQRAEPRNLEARPMQLESGDGRHAGEDSVSRVTAGSATHGSQQSPTLGCDNGVGVSVKGLEGQGSLDQMVLDPQFSRNSTSSDTENGKIDSEGIETGYMSTSEGTHTQQGGIAEDRKELKMDTDDLSTTGSQMEECIEEVQQLEKRRKELLAEVLKMRGSKAREETEGDDEEEEEEETEEQIGLKVAELMKALKREEDARREERKREVQSLREERAEEERRLWKVNLERQGLQEELRQLKRRLFAMARDCAHNQVALNNQRRDVELLKREEEKLQSLMLQLTEEATKLRSTQQQQVLQLKAEIHAQRSSQTSNTQDELTQCKRHSCGDIQQYLQGGLKFLEDRYEPIMLALLKRREVTAEALGKAKEQGQELRAQLRPLKEDIQKLKLQRACLEEKLNLIHMQRIEDVGRYKETVYWLEESSRELKTELTIQKRKTKEAEEMRDNLTKQLLIYRAAIEDHQCKDEKKT